MIKLSDELKSNLSNDLSTPSEPNVNIPKREKTPSILPQNYICKKDHELTLQGIAEMKFDKKGDIIESHGDPVIERYIYNLIQGIPSGYYEPSWNSVLEAIKNPLHLPFSRQLKYEYYYTYYYHVEILPQPEGSILLAKEIRDNYPLSLRPPNTPIAEDSPCLVPFFSYKPNWKKTDSITQYNNFGFRDDDITMPKPEGVFRIVCIGGSTTEEGNSNDMTYPNIMERKLNKYFHSNNIDVINAGICGIRSFGEVRRINEFLQFQPDLLVYYNAFNDICYHDIPYWLNLPNIYKRILTHSAFLNQIFNRKLLPSDDYIADYLQKTIFRNLGAMNCACKKEGVQMAICSFAYPKIKWYEIIAKLYYDFNLRNVWVPLEDIIVTFDTYLKIINLYNKELQKFCEQEKILYIPVAEEFNAGTDHFFDVCHMTPLGLDVKTDIIGSHLARWIEKNGYFKGK
ncbi:MAG: SGNH/GDSL hydrolase family protein [Candidatus Hydrogenedens sp.]